MLRAASPGEAMMQAAQTRSAGSPLASGFFFETGKIGSRRARRRSLGGPAGKSARPYGPTTPSRQGETMAELPPRRGGPSREATGVGTGAIGPKARHGDPMAPIPTRLGPLGPSSPSPAGREGASMFT